MKLTTSFAMSLFLTITVTIQGVSKTEITHQKLTQAQYVKEKAVALAKISTGAAGLIVCVPALFALRCYFEKDQVVCRHCHHCTSCRVDYSRILPFSLMGEVGKSFIDLIKDGTAQLKK